jgi:myosin-crossreactive antigen
MMAKANRDTKVFATGGGIGSLAAAAFMIRDGGLPGANITIYEALPVLGGSLDAAGDPETGYSLRGGRMFTTDNYECTWGSLGASRITDWLSPEFFTTKFWFMWATTFAFQPWHSAVEFKRYLHRFIKEFSRIETLAGVKRTVFNQYDSLVRPLEGWLEKHGVRFIKDCTVADLDLTHIDGKTAVSGLKLR